MGTLYAPRLRNLMGRILKRVVNLVLSAGMFLVDWASDLARRVAGKRRPPICVVLYYHSIPVESRLRFEQQMATLLRWAQPVAADRISGLADGGRYAVVTFDDGFESFAGNALPVLKERGICATVFVVTDFLGDFGGWRRFDPPSNHNERLMSPEQLILLPADLISIGSHTVTHPLLTSLSEDAAKEELLQSRLRLQGMLRRDIKLFSFPYGAFNTDLVSWCREAGYSRVFTIQPIRASTDGQDYVTGRFSVEPTDWRIEFFLKLMGAYRWQPLAFAFKKYMVLVTKRFKRCAIEKSVC